MQLIVTYVWKLIRTLRPWELIKERSIIPTSRYKFVRIAIILPRTVIIWKDILIANIGIFLLISVSLKQQIKHVSLRRIPIFKKISILNYHWKKYFMTTSILFMCELNSNSIRTNFHHLHKKDRWSRLDVFNIINCK